MHSQEVMPGHAWPLGIAWEGEILMHQPIVGAAAWWGGGGGGLCNAQLIIR